MAIDLKIHIAFVLLVFASFTCGFDEDQTNGTISSFKTLDRYTVFQFNWNEVSVPLTVSAWILLASIASIGFHQSKKIAEIFPECSLLIVLGLGVGAVLAWTHITTAEYFALSANIFFLYLLPPIIFEAGYSMPNRAFFDNIGSILVFAVLGTLWNTVAIGVSLWLLGLTGIFGPVLPLLHFLLFAALISAVDPVAVLVVFEEIHVNDVLFITVFGESLLNDAVTVVLYRIFLSFAEIGSENLIAVDYAAGAVSCFTVSFGGIAIGVVWALVVSFLTKFTKHVKVVNPVFVFIMPYCAYLVAEMFGMSAILAIVFCAIVMKPYVKLNVSPKAVVAIKYFSKMLATSSETIIFMFLGLSTIALETFSNLNIAFVGFTLLFCLVYRPIGVIVQCYFVNMFRMHPFTKVDQFVMSYGGLRGAIAYGLAISIPEQIGSGEKNMFVNTCIIVIIFTVFVQGLTMKPLINYLQVKKDDRRTKTMHEHIFDRFNDCTLAGIEHICGLRGEHWLRHQFDVINERYLKPVLVHQTKTQLSEHSKIFREFARITVSEAVNIIQEKINASTEEGTLTRPINLSMNEITENVYRKLSNVSPASERADVAVRKTTKLEHLDVEMLHKLKLSMRRGNAPSASLPPIILCKENGLLNEAEHRQLGNSVEVNKSPIVPPFTFVLTTEDGENINVFNENSPAMVDSEQHSWAVSPDASISSASPQITFTLTTENGGATEVLPSKHHHRENRQQQQLTNALRKLSRFSPNTDRAVFNWRQSKNSFDPELGEEKDGTDWLTTAPQKERRMSASSTRSYNSRADPERGEATDKNDWLGLPLPKQKSSTSSWGSLKS